MVINTFLTLEIGSKHTGIVTDTDKKEVITTFIILRELTQDEYLQWLKESPFDWTVSTFRSYPNLKFYEVATD